MFGAIIPAPLHIPPKRIGATHWPESASTANIFGRVSVVMMALATRVSVSLSRSSAPTASSIPARSFSIGSRCPMMPVEAVRTELGAMFRCRLTHSARVRLSVSPCSPLHALAFPALQSSARAVPFLTIRREYCTQAA